jgi:hypothetical protein
MLCQAVGVAQGELSEFSQYLSLVSTVVRRFSIVPICSKRLFVVFFKSCISFFLLILVYVLILLCICVIIRILFGYLSICYSWLSV